MTAVKEFFKNTSLFRKIYIIDLFFCMVSFLQLLGYVLLPFLFFWGLWLVFYNQRRYNTFFNMRFGIWIGAFMAFSLLAIVFNITLSVLLSVLGFFHMFICFFVFYGIHTEPDFDFKKELYFLAYFIAIATTIMNTIGFFCLMFGVHFDWNFEELYWIRFPLYENRFTGVFFNPNLLGFVSVVGIVCCHILHKDTFVHDLRKPKSNRVFLAACGVTNVFSLILCDSNAAFVLGLGYVLIYVIYMFFDVKRKFSLSKLFLRILTLIVVCAVITGASMAFRTVFKAGFAVVNAKTNAFVDVLFHDEEIIDEIESEAEIEADENGEASFEHENANIDSGRFKLWDESIGLFRLSPVIGISYGNIVNYSNEYLNGVLQFDYNHYDLHNGFLTILVSTGAIGALLFCIFGFRVAKHSVQHLFLQETSYRYDVYPCLFAFLGAYVFYSFFEKALLYDISFLVMWFWLFMGYLSCFIVKHESNLQNRYLFGKKRFTRAML